ncbi:DUF3331 domain-containing protein [Caballeronia sordidicola]|uniref:DUF3331 domain-containing protein n=1 Tax=Caballeronia sordidicola TaxID=196367 RepID=UPI000A379BE3
MDPIIENLTAWLGILVELRAATSRPGNRSSRGGDASNPLGNSRQLARSQGRATKTGERHVDRAANVRVVEWSERNLIIVWHDPTACSYDDQRWRRSRSRTTGICALTGEVIQRGQDIFRPSQSKPPPANAEAMILVSALPPALEVLVVPA